MSEISNPHDSFFKETFGRKEIATDFLEAYLPRAIRERIKLDSLTISRDSFIDKELRQHFSDLLYTVEQNNGSLCIYLLFEHKSSPEPWISLQLLRYMVRIWEHFRKQHPKAKKIPVVLPLVLYHGRTRWRIPHNFKSLFADGDDFFAAYIPDFNYQFHDFSHISDKEVRGKVMGRAVLLLLKHIFDPQLTHKLPGIINLLDEIQSGETGLEILEIMLRYVVGTTEHYNDEEKITELLHHTFVEEDIMQTFIDRYIEQGMKKGMQQGIQQGSRQVLIRLIKKKFGRLPVEIELKLNQADEDRILDWSERILTANSIGEVFGN